MPTSRSCARSASITWTGWARRRSDRAREGRHLPRRPAGDAAAWPTPPQSVVDTARRVGAHLRLRGRDFDSPGACRTAAGTSSARATHGPPCRCPRCQVRRRSRTRRPCSRRSNRSRDRVHCDRAVDRTRSCERVACRPLSARGRTQPASSGSSTSPTTPTPRACSRRISGTFRPPGARSPSAACSRTRTCASVLGALRMSVDRWFAATTDGPRATGRRTTRRARAAHRDRDGAGGTVAEAMRLRERGGCRPGDRIVVFGSFHTVGPALVPAAESPIICRAWTNHSKPG